MMMRSSTPWLAGLLAALAFCFRVGGAEASAGGRSVSEVAADACAVPADLTTPAYPLSRAAARLAADKSLLVVLIGSASSTGRGVSSPAHSYPMLLENNLAEALGERVTVVKKAVPGLTAALAADHLESEVLPLHPGLVVWEAGTTDAVKGVDVGDFGEALLAGLQKIYGQGADVIVVDLQYSPQTAAMFNFQPYLDYLHQVAEATNSIVFPRWEIMQTYTEDGRFDPMASTAAEQYRNADFLHGCLARLLAGEIADAIKLQP